MVEKQSVVINQPRDLIAHSRWARSVGLQGQNGQAVSGDFPTKKSTLGIAQRTSQAAVKLKSGRLKLEEFVFNCFIMIYNS